jgi:hypothetical protein
METAAALKPQETSIGKPSNATQWISFNKLVYSLFGKISAARSQQSLLAITTAPAEMIESFVAGLFCWENTGTEDGIEGRRGGSKIEIKTEKKQTGEKQKITRKKNGMKKIDFCKQRKYTRGNTRKKVSEEKVRNCGRYENRKT